MVFFIFYFVIASTVLYFLVLVLFITIRTLVSGFSWLYRIVSGKPSPPRPVCRQNPRAHRYPADWAHRRVVAYHRAGGRCEMCGKVVVSFRPIVCHDFAS